MARLSLYSVSAAAVALALLAPPVKAQTTERVNVASDSTQGNLDSSSPS